MSRKLLRTMALWVACMTMGALAQSPTGDPGATTSTATDTSQSDTTSVLTPTGRMEEHPVRASKLMGAPVKSASGEELGTISDVIVNPTSGRIEFGVVALASTGAATSGEKLVAIPWSLLSSSAPLGYESGSKIGGAHGQAFMFTGDHTKLQGAPSFDQNNWPDFSTSEWRQSVYSYYGIHPSATGGTHYPTSRTPGTGVNPGTPQGVTPGTPPPSGNYPK